jgi:protein-serine/threonine kinase
MSEATLSPVLSHRSIQPPDPAVPPPRKAATSPPLNGNGTSNGTTAVAANDVPTPAKKPTISNRLTRMFSQKEKPGSINDADSIKTSSREPKPTDTSASDTDASVTSTKTRPPRSAREPSSADRKAEDKKKGTATTTKAAAADHIIKRFEVMPDGTHEHHLKSAKRQEKLMDMFKGMMGGKGKEENANGEDPQLSLMSSWVDQLKIERERLAIDKKGGPNATATLVQKYGKCQEIVGRGAFGIVRISHKTDPTDSKLEQLYAVKEFRRRPQESPKKYQKRLTSEFCISSSLRHPNVIHTLDLLKDAKGDYCEVMEFCAGGDLYTLVLAAGKLEVTEADCCFKQLMRGVEYMHEMGVAHRDLKPENLLLTTHGSLKITDFGNGECFRMAWENEAHMTEGLCGSAPYIAPEEYTDREFDPRAVDVWACGVIYMAMRTGRHLWRVAKRDDDEFFQKYLEGRRDEAGYAPIETLHRVSTPPCSFKAATNTSQARCRNVIYSILDPMPSRRITASQVLKSEWGREIKLCTAGEEGF